MGNGEGIARPQTVAVGVEVPSVSFKLRHHAWATWARIAIDHERYAHAHELRASGDVMEFEPGLAAITSTAFALDALYGVVRAHIPAERSPDEPAAGDPSDRGRWVAEWLKRAVARGGGRTQTWPKRIGELFDDRDRAVHFEEADEDPVPHPTLETHVGRHAVEWGADAATRAVDLLVEVLVAWIDQPNDSMRLWVENCAPTVRDPLARRVGRSGV